MPTISPTAGRSDEPCAAQSDCQVVKVVACATAARTALRRWPGWGAMGTIGLVFKLFGEQTNGQVSVVEHPFPVGACVPPHMHTREDEYSIVTEGEIGFRSGDREVVLGAGGYITKPRGETHTMWNAGPTPTRMIEIISPAGFEHFFLGMTELASAGPPDPESIAALAADHGLVSGNAPWLEDVIARYDLTPPPGRR